MKQVLNEAMYEASIECAVHITTNNEEPTQQMSICRNGHNITQMQEKTGFFFSKSNNWFIYMANNVCYKQLKR